MIENPLFLISTGRTGTYFLKYFFQNYTKDCLGQHEPKPAFKRRGFQLVNRDHTFFERIYFQSFREFRMLNSDHEFYVEANNCLFSAIPLIRKCYSNATIVHIIRDGREVVRSYINSGKRYVSGETVLTPDNFDNDPYESDWGTMNPIERTAWFWLRVNEVIENHQPDMTIFFEDLFNSPHKPLYECVEKVPGLKIREEQVEKAFQNKKNTSNHLFIPKWCEWFDHWKQQFSDICSEKMEEYGYSLST